MIRNLPDLICEEYLEMDAESPDWNKNFQLTGENLQEGKAKTDDRYIFDPEYPVRINHEIRTSMNAIMGFTQILNCDGILNEDRKSYSEIIIKETENLLQAFDQILARIIMTSVTTIR